jgi:hypothetical protein
MKETQKNSSANTGLVAVTGKLPALSSKNLKRISVFLMQGSTILSESPASAKGHFQFHVAPQLARDATVFAVLGPKGLDSQSLASKSDLPRIALSSARKIESGGLNVDFSNLNINDKLIDPWWIWCREYTVSGTLQTAANCTIAAEVTVYNVTSGVSGLVESPIVTVPTDANGNFTASFNWCSERFCWWPCWPIWWQCWPWWWELDILAVIDNLERRLQSQSVGAATVAFSNVAPLRQPNAADLMTGVGFAAARAGAQLQPDSARTSMIASKFANPGLREIFPWWWWCCENPNLVFSASQGTTLVLNEDPDTSTRWCFASGQAVSLTGNSEGVGACQVQTCGSCGFEWSSVGDMPGGFPTIDITSGYAAGSGACSNLAFNGLLNLWGNFGGDCIVFYQVLVGQWGGNGNPARGGTPPLAYEPLSVPLSDYVTILRGGTWLAPVPVALGPCSFNGVDSLYMTRIQRQTGFLPAGLTGLPPFPTLEPGDQVFWGDGSGATDLVLSVQASNLVGALGVGGVTLSLAPYDNTATPLPTPLPSSFEDDLTLMIDTTPLTQATIDWDPPAQSGVFSGVYNADGTPATLSTGSTLACPSYQITGSGYVLIHSTVVDNNGHLCEYYIQTQYGDGLYAAPTPSDRDYAQPPATFTTAGTPPASPLAVDTGYSVPNTNSSPTSGTPSIPARSFVGGGDTAFIPITESCCYDFQLWVSKRTTDGQTFWCSQGNPTFQTVNIVVVPPVS